MTYDMNKKKASRLTSALLARKGSATPSPASALLNRQAINRFVEPQTYQPKEQEKVLGKTVDVVKNLIDRQSGKLSDNQFENESAKPLTQTPLAKTNEEAAPQVKKTVNKAKSKTNNSPKTHKALARKRIAMTLRMQEDEHLKLRLFSAYGRKSCQTILMEALDLYYRDHADQVPPLEMATRKA